MGTFKNLWFRGTYSEQYSIAEKKRNLCKINNDNNQINNNSYHNIINKKNNNENLMKKLTKEYKALNGEIEEIMSKKRNIGIKKSIITYYNNSSI